MSPSSTSTKHVRSTAPVTAGLSIGRDRVRYVELGHQRGMCQVLSVLETALPMPVFVSASAATDPSVTAEIAKTVGSLRQRCVPLHVSVADPATRWRVFELDELPRRPAAQRALAELRMVREIGTTDCLYAAQPLGMCANGKHLLLAGAMSIRVRDAVATALEEGGAVPWSLASDAVHYFNLYRRVCAGRSGALAVLSADAWSIVIFDERAVLRFVRAHWRSSDLTASDIAMDMQRTILAYVQSAPGRTVEDMWLCGSDDLAALEAEINRRAAQPCRLLDLQAFHPRLPMESYPVAHGPAVAAALQSCA